MGGCGTERSGQRGRSHPPAASHCLRQKASGPARPPRGSRPAAARIQSVHMAACGRSPWVRNSRATCDWRGQAGRTLVEEVREERCGKAGGLDCQAGCQRCRAAAQGLGVRGGGRAGRHVSW